ALLGALSLRRRGWRRATVAGVPVLVSASTGPAVVGFLRGRIVLPEWALAWDGERQRMMVEHEREHLRARDPLLLLLAFTAAAAFPWNAALWWQLRRLRLAMEVDCDARVLRRHSDVRAYGLLLLEVGRVASSGRLPLVALTEPPSFLERRIHAMTRPVLQGRIRRAVLSTAICAGALALAAAIPAPAGGVAAGVAFGLGRHPAPADTIPLRAGVIDVRQATERPELVNALEVQRLLQNHYPPLLRAAGVTGTAQVQMVIAEDGSVAEARVLEATHAALGEAAVAVMRQARFRPAKRDGRPVAVRVQLPVKFEPGDGSARLPGVPAVSAGVGEGIVDVQALDRQPEVRNREEVWAILKEGYPPLLRDAGIMGEAMVEFVVTAEGATSDVRLVSASHAAFGEPALAAARAMRFTPGELGGRATAARVRMPFAFTLSLPEPSAAPEGR
ncbi:MAG TPA: M56 family metallopeptidase, partial [Longimicrobiaceae bacterium]|nr:M56 family metallopeptidase [Longimicrobiaceae bacterium]